MADTLAGFPFWKLQFNEKGDPPTGGDSFLAGVPSVSLTDLFVFSHGWNNDPTTAMALYTGFFGEVRKIVDNASVPKRRQAVIGVTGIVWPSILFPDDAGSANTGGAASFDPTAGTTGAGGRGHLKHAKRLQPRACGARCARGAGIADCVRQRRESDDGPGGGAGARDGATRRDRRRTMASGANWS